MPNKYSPLESYFKSLPPGEREVRLSFERIDSIIHSKLPASANELSWWQHETEGNHINKRAWANAGWRIETVHLRERWVRFVRVSKL
jgi:hypothetical protein